MCAVIIQTRISSMDRVNLNQWNAYRIDPVLTIPHFHPFSVGVTFNPYKMLCKRCYAILKKLFTARM